MPSACKSPIAASSVWIFSNQFFVVAVFVNAFSKVVHNPLRKTLRALTHFEWRRVRLTAAGILIADAKVIRRRCDHMPAIGGQQQVPVGTALALVEDQVQLVLRIGRQRGHLIRDTEKDVVMP